MPNIIRGTTKNDILQGTNGDDHFIGDLGDDVFILGGGQDVVWGGRGTDIARLSGSSVDYDIYYNGEAWWFVYSKINSTDYYQLNTEKIEFSDKQENLNQPTYTVVADRGNVSEGQEVTYSLSTNTFPSFNGYLLSWMYWLKFDIRGVTSDDIASVSSGSFNGVLFDSKTMSGYVAISSKEGTGNIKVKLATDSQLENETLIIDFIIQTDVVNSVSNRILDSSSNVPTYALAASSASVNEGSTATFILSTTNVVAGTQVGYTLSGVSAADVQGGNLSGNATVGSNGQATISVELLADKLTEGVETLTVTAGDKTASTTINDTSTPITKTYTANIFSVNPSKQEGNFSGTKFDFLVELDSTPLEQQRISFSVISNETNSDDFLSFTNLDSTLFFEAGEKQKTISVFAAGDTIVEKDETFSVQINQISSQTEIGLKSKATSIIVNDDFSSVKNFDIIINYSGDTRYKSYFDFAEELLEQIIIKDIPDVKNSAGYIIDDLVINAFVEPIDGLGNILGMAGPTALRASSYLPYEGMMKFDSADISKLVTNGTFGDVVLHEMFHVLGFGTIWSFLNLNKAVGKYVGQNALAEYKSLTNDLSKQFVPLETGGGRGTANSHWSEAVFGTEIMTGYAENSNMPLTRLTIASLVDLGYSVDLTKAELLSQMLRMSSLDHSGNVTSISETGSTISGTVGNDKLLGTARNEVIDGGDGVDVFIVAGTRSEYQISINFGKVGISDVGSPKGGTDTLTSVERIDFTDGDLIFDVASANAPGAYRLYGGAFDRTPDETGFRFWTSYLDKNASLHTVATEFIKSDEFIARYGATLSNSAFVDALYQNVLDRRGDSGGVAYWNQQLDNKLQDRSDVLVQFTQLPEFVGISAANISNGYWVV